MNNDFRIGVDAGGTFTDFVLAEKTGDIHLFKAPSTPEDGTLAIANGLQQIANKFNRPIEDIIQACDLCINRYDGCTERTDSNDGRESGLAMYQRA